MLLHSDSKGLRRVLETVKDMEKRYDDEPGAKRPKRMQYIEGAWHIPL
jgi:hypothetical protein